jgi:hypothetical protein
LRVYTLGTAGFISRSPVGRSPRRNFSRKFCRNAQPGAAADAQSRRKIASLPPRSNHITLTHPAESAPTCSQHLHAQR